LRIHNSQYGYFCQRLSDNSVTYWLVSPRYLLILRLNLFSRMPNCLDTHVVLLITSSVVLISRIQTKFNVLITFIAGVTTLLSGSHVPQIWMQRAWLGSPVLFSKALNTSCNTIFHFVKEWTILARQNGSKFQYTAEKWNQGKTTLFLLTKFLFSYKYLWLHKPLSVYLGRIQGSSLFLSANLIFPIFKHPTVYIYFSSLNAEIIWIHNSLEVT
jgi:hypothetical protein